MKLSKRLRGGVGHGSQEAGRVVIYGVCELWRFALLARGGQNDLYLEMFGMFVWTSGRQIRNELAENIARFVIVTSLRVASIK